MPGRHQLNRPDITAGAADVEEVLPVGQKLGQKVELVTLRLAERAYGCRRTASRIDLEEPTVVGGSEDDRALRTPRATWTGGREQLQTRTGHVGDVADGTAVHSNPLQEAVGEESNRSAVR